jgi:hypothetical protein
MYKHAKYGKPEDFAKRTSLPSRSASESYTQERKLSPNELALLKESPQDRIRWNPPTSKENPPKRDSDGLTQFYTRMKTCLIHRPKDTLSVFRVMTSEHRTDLTYLLWKNLSKEEQKIVAKQIVK